MINLDETSVKLCPVTTRGYVIFDLRGRRAILRQGPRPSLSMRRSAVSLVAFLCDDELIQPLLPQVFITNEHVLSAADAADLNSTCPRNVFVARRRSSWVNAPMLCEIVGLLAASLGNVIRSRAVVLCMDTYKAHLHNSVLAACARAGIFIMYIPASTTGWLQPLDVCVFNRYKMWVVRELERLRLATPTGTLPRAVVLDAYCRGICSVLEAQSWSRAFAVTGLSGQGDLSAELKRRLQWDIAERVPSTLPSLSDLQSIYPRNSHIPLAELFALSLQHEARRLVDPARMLRLPRRARLPGPVAAGSV
jgi:hypothetical protein